MGPLNSSFLYHLRNAMPNYWSNTFLLESQLADSLTEYLDRGLEIKKKKVGGKEAGLRAPVCLSSSARHWHCSPAAWQCCRSSHLLWWGLGKAPWVCSSASSARSPHGGMRRASHAWLPSWHDKAKSKEKNQKKSRNYEALNDDGPNGNRMGAGEREGN